MGLVNARYYASGKFFWDERASSLEDQVLQPIQDPIEMGMTIDSVISRLEQLSITHNYSSWLLATKPLILCDYPKHFRSLCVLWFLTPPSLI